MNELAGNSDTIIINPETLAWIPTGPSILNKQAFGFNAGSLSRNPNVI